jgi:type II secretory pathway component PulJ
VTIIELVITSALLLVVLLTVFNALDSVSGVQAYQADRTRNLDDMRNVINKMTKEIRQATAVEEITDPTVNTLASSSLTYTTSLNGTATSITYAATGTMLTRKVGAGTAFTVLNNLASTTIFTRTRATDVTGVQWVEIDLTVNPARRPTTTLELQSEVNLRNRTSSLTGAS